MCLRGGGGKVRGERSERAQGDTSGTRKNRTVSTETARYNEVQTQVETRTVKCYFIGKNGTRRVDSGREIVRKRKDIPNRCYFIKYQTKAVGFLSEEHRDH